MKLRKVMLNVICVEQINRIGETIMEYDKERNGVEVVRDHYSEHFSPTVKINYMVNINGMCVVEGENTKDLSKELEGMSEQLLKWSRHLGKLKKK